MPVKVETKWWVFDKGDAHTNEVLASLPEGIRDVDFLREGVECPDGVKRNLHLLPDHALLRRLERSRKSLNLVFEPYVSRGNGKPALWKLEKKKKIDPFKLKGKARVRKAATAP